VTHAVVSHDEWIEARKALLAEEKRFTRARDELSRQRRELPWEVVEKEYAFEGARGRETLADLFDGRSQLVVYHFMFEPDVEEGCPHCSFWADSFDANVIHLNHRDVSFAAVSRAPHATLAAYRERMGWDFHWLSAVVDDFNLDFGVTFAPEEQNSPVYNYGTIAPGRSDREGVSVFYRDEVGRIFHTYSAYARGIDMLNAAYHYLDLVPNGRDEDGRPQFWVRRRDQYED
jgi:predicted dithiol-disulfide oxidoreductase (DUF899 family)